ncbi:bifunctional metallophosphatase/5'-nucleotidase [Mucilaginibacter aquatilis]|uniref:Bifunctional metallophosphatase/5'-nucleotidase n=1 Tax=Mucilaginibacter aquatilis TaxID=1517760 RepID=A0A6I4IR99_9SPHI|nr:metallophosphatase [Mucilaginibacter aquatilis]MVN93123.1 bifunctional metallophosphatase/5'-nucleotidase [Mucilaginibacter aquatilis]
MDELKKINRRQFVKVGGVLAASAAMSAYAVDALAAGDLQRLTILHTNDVHSRIEPFPMDGSRNQGLGGAARRAALINKIRQEQSNVLLLDAGDIFQGTPYFNMFGGELELKLMSDMGYDAATMGNHDFDNGIEGFYKQLPNANFPILMSNYDFSNTVMHASTKPYKIFNKQGLKIGVFGLGIELAGLVDPRNYKETQYLDPVKKGNEIAALLKNELKCDLVICLSHLGYSYRENKVSDKVLAAQTRNIDLIIGGHTHTFLDEPEDVKNLDGEVTTINQVGWAGINLGRIDYYFEKRNGKKSKQASQYQITNGL